MTSDHPRTSVGRGQNARGGLVRMDLAQHLVSRCLMMSSECDLTHVDILAFVNEAQERRQVVWGCQSEASMLAQ